MKIWFALILTVTFIIGAVAGIERLCMEKHSDGPQIEAEHHESVTSTDASKCHHQAACQHGHFGQYILTSSVLLGLERPTEKIVPPGYSALFPLHSNFGFFRPPIA